MQNIRAAHNDFSYHEIYQPPLRYTYAPATDQLFINNYMLASLPPLPRQSTRNLSDAFPNYTWNISVQCIFGKCYSTKLSDYALRCRMFFQNVEKCNISGRI